jgi:hypothetical protein
MKAGGNISSQPASAEKYLAEAMAVVKSAASSASEMWLA